MHAADFLRKLHAHFVHNRYKVGRIDRLVLKKAASEKGISILKKEISEHKFTQTVVLETMPPRYMEEPNPYVIKQVVTKNGQTPLSKAVFDIIYTLYVHELGRLLPGNPLNAQYQKGDFRSSDRIDYCTSATTLDGSYLGDATTVRLSTKFYDKSSLLKALKALPE